MRNAYRLAALLIPVAATGCSAGERGMVSPHQPLVTATGAAVPGCPDWSDKELPSASDGMSSNFGCAEAANLAAMIADPNDLLHGKSAEGSRVEISVRAIRSWRKTAPTGEGGVDKVSAKGGN